MVTTNTTQLVSKKRFPTHEDLKAGFGQTWFGCGRTVAEIYQWLMFKMDVSYKTPIPGGPKILAANHPCTIDPVMMTTLVPEPVSILILDTLFKIPLFGASLKLSGHIRVDNGNGNASLEEGLRRLQAGCTLGIFPEGIITSLGNMTGHAHTGMARLALSTGVPVIPIGIFLDSQYLWHTNSRVKGEMEVGTWYVHGPYAITIGEPVTFNGSVEDRQLVRSVTAEIMQHVAALTQESARRLYASRKAPVSTHVYDSVRFLWFLTRGAFRTV